LGGSHKVVDPNWGQKKKEQVSAVRYQLALSSTMLGARTSERMEMDADSKGMTLHDGDRMIDQIACRDFVTYHSFVILWGHILTTVRTMSKSGLTAVIS